MKTESAPTVTYGGIEIAYSEDRDQWTFELRGSQRWAKTLKAAKESIDKPAPVSKKPFARFTAFKKERFGYTTAAFDKVEVTSIAGMANYGGGVEVWISDSRDKRSKEKIVYLIADTPANAEKMGKYVALETEITKLEKQRDAIKFDAPTLPKDTELPE